MTTRLRLMMLASLCGCLDGRGTVVVEGTLAPGDADSDADADSDSDSDSDSDADADADPGCVYPAGPYGSSEGDILADFLQALPECGAGTPTTLSTFCEAPAIVLHFNAPG